MPRLSATTRPVDESRCTRLLIAWATGDRFALDVVVEEAMAEPVGVPGLLFALVEFATSIGEQAAPDLVDQLRARLLEDEEQQ